MIHEIFSDTQMIAAGDYVCLGYWNDPDATARTLRADPLSPPGNPGATRVVYTGDQGCVDDEGLLYFRGLRDHVLKSMSVRVSPDDVEDLLYRSGLVTHVAVVGRPSELIGDEVCAFVVVGEACANPQRELGEYARRAMSAYMVPRRFFVCDALPRTTTGKIDYPRLRNEARQRR